MLTSATTSSPSPLDVRRELCRAKCDAAYVVASHVDGWELHRVSPDVVPTWLCAVEAASATVFAVVPVSPIAIAKHAAKLAGAVGHTVETFADRTTAPVRFRVSDVVPGGKLTISDYADGDETGHRAAIGLLQKVMAK